MLNEKQQYIYDLMVNNKNIFITSPAGCGKSFVIKKFYNDYRLRKIIGLTSTTGISAINIGGTTLHSYLGIGLGSASKEVLSTMICRNSKLFYKWKKINTLIIDEVSMLHYELFEKLEYVARIVRGNSLPFGGIQIILSGDFLQLPAIGTDMLCFETDVWKKVITHSVQLTEIVRQKEVEFQNCLNNIRIGNINEDDKVLLSSLIDKSLPVDDGIIPTMLFTTNMNVDLLNNKEFDKLPKKDNYHSFEMLVTDCRKNKSDDKFIEKCKKNCNAKEYLELCIGSQVSLLQNIDIENGLVNGSRGVIVEFVEGIPIVKFVNGLKKIIDVSNWDYKDDDDELLVSLTMIPLKLAWALTVHGCQGQTIDYAIVNLQGVFTFAQVYVALSRVKSLSGLSIKNLNFNSITAHPKAVEFYKTL